MLAKPVLFAIIARAASTLGAAVDLDAKVAHFGLLDLELVDVPVAEVERILGHSTLR